MLEYENKYWSSGMKYIAGIDEAGRGPLAGPVIAAAVIFKNDIDLPGVNDSKKLSEKKREYLYDKIYSNALSVGIGVVYVDDIDKNNILQATYQAMRKSIGQLSIQPDLLLVDGNKADIHHYKQKNIINGDQKSISIAAASIIAKVFRDRMMKEFDIIFPKYGFSKHKGYGTKQHIEAIIKYKACPIHRKSFKPVMDNLPNVSYYKRNKLIEKLGEQLVACYLLRKGYKILEVNYQIPTYGDVGIISSKNNVLIYIDIKTTFIDGEILSYEIYHDDKKNDKIINMLSQYMDNNKLQCKLKYNIAEIIIEKGKHNIKIREMTNI